MIHTKPTRQEERRGDRGHKSASPSEATAMAAAFANAGVKKKNGKHWAHKSESETEVVIRWSHPFFGDANLKVSSPGDRQFKIGESYDDGRYTSWTRVFPSKDNVSVLEMKGDVFAYEDIHTFMAVGPKLQKLQDVIPTFQVAIEWDEKGQPKMRKKDSDNFNLDFVQEKKGIIGVLQVSLVNRDDEFYCVRQELYIGQVALVSQEEAKRFDPKRLVTVGKKVATLIPVRSCDAHEMANPFTMFPECRELVEFALEHGHYMPLRECYHVSWEPKYPNVTAQELGLPDGGVDGMWIAGTVLWDNPVIGFGFLQGQSGRNCFVHFSAIRDKHGKLLRGTGRFPVLTGEAPVLFKSKSGPKGPQATFVYQLPLPAEPEAQSQ